MPTAFSAVDHNLNELVWSESYYCTKLVTLFPGLPYFCSSVCVQYKTQKQESGEKQGRSGNTYHMNDVRWM